MYICICNALTDTDIKKAAKQDGAMRPSEVFAACKCRAQCGNCVRTVCAMLGLDLAPAEPAMRAGAVHA